MAIKKNVRVRPRGGCRALAWVRDGAVGRVLGVRGDGQALVLFKQRDRRPGTNPAGDKRPPSISCPLDSLEIVE